MIPFPKKAFRNWSQVSPLNDDMCSAIGVWGGGGNWIPGPLCTSPRLRVRLTQWDWAQWASNTTGLLYIRTATSEGCSGGCWPCWDGPPACPWCPCTQQYACWRPGWWHPPACAGHCLSAAECRQCWSANWSSSGAPALHCQCSHGKSPATLLELWSWKVKNWEIRAMVFLWSQTQLPVWWMIPSHLWRKSLLLQNLIWCWLSSSGVKIEPTHSKYSSVIRLCIFTLKQIWFSHFQVISPTRSHHPIQALPPNIMWLKKTPPTKCHMFTQWDKNSLWCLTLHNIVHFVLWSHMFLVPMSNTITWNWDNQRAKPTHSS